MHTPLCVILTASFQGVSGAVVVLSSRDMRRLARENVLAQDLVHSSTRTKWDEVEAGRTSNTRDSVTQAAGLPAGLHFASCSAEWLNRTFAFRGSHLHARRSVLGRCGSRFLATLSGGLQSDRRKCLKAWSDFWT